MANPVGDMAFSVVAVADLLAADRRRVVSLCTRAFGRSFAGLFALVPPDSTHLLARLDGRLVGHACWMTRWLQPGDLPPLRTAYVDAVAIAPDLQGHGLGSDLIARLNHELAGFEIGGLSTSRVTFYQRLGWQPWRGPTAVRTAGGLEPSSDDTIMILRTPQSPPLDLDGPLSIEWRAGSVW
ncbi:MAG TPA: GNAT family N-acetyltransferase [Thermomicrobiaceae bacterium]|nr:GNAT family N-acetyltransferase [Thermomicrobiaceae bacterium]